MTHPASAAVDAYIDAQPKPVGEALRRVRAAMRRALPDAKEVISYKVPAFRTGDGVVIWFAGWTNHYSVYPVGETVEAAVGEDLSRYGRGKGTLRFPLDEPVPEALIEAIARVRAELVSRAKAERGLRRTLKAVVGGMIGRTPEPPYYAVIFTSLRTEGDDDGYAKMARLMEELAAEQPGYLGIESARSELGLTISYWRDEASMAAWKANVQHAAAQRLGRERWYEAYRVRVAKVERAYGMDSR